MSPFIPADLDAGDFTQLEPLYQALLDRELTAPADLEAWLLDFSDLTRHVQETRSKRYIDHSCHTDDAAIEKAYLDFVENVSPKIQPFVFKLQKKALGSGLAEQLEGEAYEVLFREWRSEVDLFRDANIPLFTELTKLASEGDKLSGAMIVEFQGRERTLQQLARFLHENDRDVRQQAWELSVNRRLEDRDKFDEIFDKQLALRSAVAANADCPDFRDYTWKSYCRFDYTPDDCLAFADAVEQTCLPVTRRLQEQRKAELGVDTLRPWDLSVDPLGRGPLSPFAEQDVDRLIDGSRTMFDRIHPELGEQFRRLIPGRNLDLDSRKGKRPGGYQSSLDLQLQPFIFMNAAGLQRDVETMLHEGGHAFHYMAATDLPLTFLRHAPMEFCEVASMSMELLGDDHLDVFYDDADAARAKREHLEGTITLLPWIATIDTFQHWLYTHPGHTRDERTAAWLDVTDRFTTGLIDHTGYEDARAAMWQRQHHLFHAPFYYIEYGIAQLGALQVWMNYRDDADRALAQLREAFALGGTRPLPALFETAGIRFDFSARTLGPLMQAVQDELEMLPV